MNKACMISNLSERLNLSISYHSIAFKNQLEIHTEPSSIHSQSERTLANS